MERKNHLYFPDVSCMTVCVRVCGFSRVPFLFSSLRQRLLPVCVCVSWHGWSSCRLLFADDLVPVDSRVSPSNILLFVSFFCASSIFSKMFPFSTSCLMCSLVSFWLRSSFFCVGTDACFGGRAGSTKKQIKFG